MRGASSLFLVHEQFYLPHALISVFNKDGLDGLGNCFRKQGIEMISTGKTAQYLRDAGLPVIEISNHTDFPEIMDGRVKILHPRVFGGILGRPGQDDDVMRQHGMVRIKFVVINFYPFEEVIAKSGGYTQEEAIKNIDVGGPAATRAAVKNFLSGVTVVVDPNDYNRIIKEMDRNGSIYEQLRCKLASKAFEYTERYDGAIKGCLQTMTASYFS